MSAQQSLWSTTQSSAGQVVYLGLVFGVPITAALWVELHQPQLELALIPPQDVMPSQVPGQLSLWKIQSAEGQDFQVAPVEVPTMGSFDDLHQPQVDWPAMPEQDLMPSQALGHWSALGTHWAGAHDFHCDPWLSPTMASCLSSHQPQLLCPAMPSQLVMLLQESLHFEASVTHSSWLQLP